MNPHLNPTGRRHDVERQDDRGFTLIEILIAIVLVGILSAVAVVGISTLVSKGSKSACAVTADSARAAAGVYLATNVRFPVNFLELTAAGSGGGVPMSLPAGVTPTPILVTTLVVNSGTSWSLTMTPGTLGAAPTFACTP